MATRVEQTVPEGFSVARGLEAIPDEFELAEFLPLSGLEEVVARLRQYEATLVPDSYRGSAIPALRLSPLDDPRVFGVGELFAFYLAPGIDVPPPRDTLAELKVVFERIDIMDAKYAEYLEKQASDASVSEVVINH